MLTDKLINVENSCIQFDLRIRFIVSRQVNYAKPKPVVLFHYKIILQSTLYFYILKLGTVAMYFCRTCFSMGDRRASFRRTVRSSTFTLGCLMSVTLLQFCTDHLETLQVFLSCYEDVHVVSIYLLDYVLSLFPLFDLNV